MISNLRIKRFKCFEDIKIDFGKITILAGINGTGKSTVIQSLLLLRQAYLAGILKKNAELSLNGEFIKIGTSKDALFVGSQKDSICFSTVFSEKTEKKFSWLFNYNKEKPDQYIMKGISESKDEGLLPKSGPFAPRFSYISAERLGPRLTYPKSEMRSEEMDVGINGEFTAHCLAKMGDQKIANHDLALTTDQSGSNLSLSNQAQLWMRKFIPNVSFNVETIDKADSVRLEVKVYDDQLDYIRPTNMGFGFSYTLPVIVASLIAKPGGMLIIENPEAHLHPAGQSEIARFLAKVAKGGVQVIIETHSDHILNGVRLSAKQEDGISHDDIKILFFSRENDLGTNKIESLNVFKDGGIDRWPKGFFDQLDIDLEGLL